MGFADLLRLNVAMGFANPLHLTVVMGFANSLHLKCNKNLVFDSLKQSCLIFERACLKQFIILMLI